MFMHRICSLNERKWSIFLPIDWKSFHKNENKYFCCGKIVPAPFTAIFKSQICHSKFLNTFFLVHAHCTVCIAHWTPTMNISIENCSKSIIQIIASTSYHSECKLCQCYFRPLLIAFFAKINNMFFCICLIHFGISCYFFRAHFVWLSFIVCIVHI